MEDNFCPIVKKMDVAALGGPGGVASEHDAPRFLPSFLGDHLALVEPALRQSMPRRRAPVASMAAHHMGWSNAELGRQQPNAGKRLRASLCLWACTACGGPAQMALPAAVAVEWVHNFTLVHDDVQDHDLERRHRPTVWAIWGKGQAINAGDWLFALGLSAISRRGPYPRRRRLAAGLLADAVLRVVEGQCLDLSLEGRPQASPQTYLRLARFKTGALLGASLGMGAVMAGAAPQMRRRFQRAGELLGTAFQVRDDWLGIWGDSALTGKSRDNDLARRKVTYPVVSAYAAATPAQRRRMRQLYSSSEAGQEDQIRSLLLELGGPRLTADVPMRLADAALRAFDGAALPDEHLQQFEELVHFVALRES